MGDSSRREPIEFCPQGRRGRGRVSAPALRAPLRKRLAAPAHLADRPATDKGCAPDRCLPAQESRPVQRPGLRVVASGAAPALGSPAGWPWGAGWSLRCPLRPAPHGQRAPAHPLSRELLGNAGLRSGDCGIQTGVALQSVPPFSPLSQLHGFRTRGRPPCGHTLPPLPPSLCFVAVGIRAAHCLPQCRAGVPLPASLMETPHEEAICPVRAWRTRANMRQGRERLEADPELG